MNPILEPMDEFFTRRVEGYDEHMLTEVGGCANGYIRMAEVLAARIADGARLLDLGCGTGLELDEIWRHLPGVRVTGVDMTRAMLDRIPEKHPDKQITLLCADYFTADFGGDFDAAVSFQTMHHFTRERKLGLYQKIHRSLREGGCYIECDYMCETDEQETFFLAENARLRAEQHIPEGAFFHYDTPITRAGQRALLLAAGFREVSEVFHEENTVMLVAGK